MAESSKKLAVVLTAKNTDFKQKFKASSDIAENLYKGIGKGNEAAKLSFNDLKRAQANLAKGLKDLDQDSKEYKDTLKKLNVVSSALEVKEEKRRKAMKKASRETKTASKETKSYLSTLSDVSNVIQGASVAVGSLTSAYNRLSGSLNDTAEQARFYQLTNEGLESIASRVNAISKAYDQQTKEILRAAKVISREYNLTLSQGLSIVEKSFKAGAKQSDDFLGSISEYAPQFKEAGIEAERMSSILINMSKEGFLSDKTGDVIHEATVAIREMTDSTRDAFKAIDIDPDQISESLKDGSKSIIDIINEISKKFGTLQDDSKEVGLVLADVFKGVGEDQGVKFIRMLSSASTSLDFLTERTGVATAQNEKLRVAYKKLNDELFKLFGVGDIMKEIEAGIVNFLADNVDGAIDFTEKLINGFIDAYNYIQDFFIDLKYLIGDAQIQFDSFSTVVIDAFKKIGLALKSMFGWVVDEGLDILSTIGTYSKEVMEKAGSLMAENMVKKFKEKAENDIENIDLRKVIDDMTEKANKQISRNLGDPTKLNIIQADTENIPAPKLGLESERVGEALSTIPDDNKKIKITANQAESAMMSLFSSMAQGSESVQNSLAPVLAMIAEMYVSAAAGPVAGKLAGLVVGKLASEGENMYERRPTGGQITSVNEVIRTNDGGVPEVVKPENQLNFGEGGNSFSNMVLTATMTTKQLQFSNKNGQSQLNNRRINTKTVTSL